MNFDETGTLLTYSCKDKFDVDIEVDGGITVENVRTVLDAGANIIVSGSGIYRGDVTQNVTNFLDIFKEYDSHDQH